MERFREDIKAEFSERNTPADVEAGLDLLHKLKIDECDGVALSPVSKVPAQVAIFTQVGLRRTIELVEAGIREINRRNLVATALVARGAIETSCLLWDVMGKIEEVADSGDVSRMKEFHEVMQKSLMGGKAKTQGIRVSEEIESRNVITIIERLTKRFDIPLMDCFQRLSEFAHPNYHGMMATYTAEGFDAGFKKFCDRRQTTERALIVNALGALAGSCSIVVKSFEMMAAHLEALALLAEREIYEKGEWPANEPYPVKRGE